MKEKYNYNFCRRKNDTDYCYSECSKTCPTLSNFWHGRIASPILHFCWYAKHGFSKCTKLDSSCDFRYCKKGCMIDRKCK